jgi:hypothetical protein
VVAGDHHLRALADDVATQADPRSASQFQAEADGFADRAGDALRQTRRFQHDEQTVRSACEGRETVQPICHPGRSSARGVPASGPGVLCAEARWQVDQQQIHRAALEECARDAQPFVHRLRREDDEPLQAHAPCDGLHGIERARQVQVRDDRAARLGFRGEPERKRGLAAAGITVHRNRRGPGHAAGPEDRVQRREPGMDDPTVVDGRRMIPVRERYSGERADGLRTFVQRPRSCGTPASLEGRQSGADLGRGNGHPRIIEQMF